ncbi:MAG: MSCRAMM family protein, partial [Terriglobales bacterium]
MRLARTTRTLRLLATIPALWCGLTTVGCTGLSSGSGNHVQNGAYDISGTITGVGGATLTLSGTAKGTATADASGKYTFSGLANGSYTITPSKTGFVFSPPTETAAVNGADVAGMDFGAAASQLYSIHGSITPAGSGNNATVTLGGAGDAITTADDSGNYVFTGVASGSYTVTPARYGVLFTPYSQNAAVNGSDLNGVNFLGASGCSGGHGTANFYVSPGGNDSWSGTLDCPSQGFTDGPFASLARAQIAVQTQLKNHPGSAVVVMVREGTYYLPLSPTNPGTLNFTPSDSGTASAPVTWENYPNEAPVVNGGIPLSGWTQVSGPLWQVSVPANTPPFESLFYNGERRQRSRLQSAAAGTGYYMSGGSCISSQSKQVVSTSLCNLGTFLRVAAEIPPTGANATCPAYSDGPDSKCM